MLFADPSGTIFSAWILALASAQSFVPDENGGERRGEVIMAAFIRPRSRMWISDLLGPARFLKIYEIALERLNPLSAMRRGKAGN